MPAKIGHGAAPPEGNPQGKHEGYFRLVRAEIAPLLPDRTERVLELGCGAGASMAWLRTIRTIGRAHGVELSADAAERARAVFDSVVVGDAEDPSIDLGEGPYDLVLTLDVLEHLADPWAVLRRLRERMAPDATLIASIPNMAHYSVALPLLLRGRFDYVAEGLLDRTHLRFFTRASVVALFEETSFAIRRIGVTTVAPRTLQALGLRGPRWHWYNIRLWRLLLPRHLFDYQFLVAATPRR